METEEATASCIIRAADSSEVQYPRPQQKQMQERYRLDVFNEVLHRLREAALPEALLPSFEGKLWTHFHRLPAWYVSVCCDCHLLLQRPCAWVLEAERRFDAFSRFFDSLLICYFWSLQLRDGCECGEGRGCYDTYKVARNARDPAKRPVFAVRLLQVKAVLAYASCYYPHGIFYL
ncbi:hypothetical protein BHE74_00006067 [Ensete ventricosum]|nr:hypothetical protein BHE74_00006067 [Ensete ventricosum]